MKAYENGIREVDKINLVTALLDGERLKKEVTFYTRNRVFIDRFTCRDYENKPFTLENYVTHGGLVYYKQGRFEWKTISIDDIIKIEIA